jgi:hypothetical protein
LARSNRGAKLNLTNVQKPVTMTTFRQNILTISGRS